ncbi:MAG: glycosyltransferase [Paracoccaceae bacterium]
MNTQTSLFRQNPTPPAHMTPDTPSATRPALICFSHLRWDFVHQRPQHLLIMAARDHSVCYIEEPITAPGEAHFRMRVQASGVTVLTPVFDAACDPVHEQQMLVHRLQQSLVATPILHWYYTPMALAFTRDLPCDLCVYDCMDELSAFRFAPAELVSLESELLARADLVFTGGRSLFAAKRRLHADVHCFPSSVDIAHFARARLKLDEPIDQDGIPHPRIGYVGVIDERIDLDLIATAAAELPLVQFVMIGPTAKIKTDDLPHAPNIHWLGRKTYDELPAYLANWQAAWMPFALNEATRFISPTKTPEYLAAGLRVVSTAVADVVDAYGNAGLVSIADPETIVPTLKTVLGAPPEGWLLAVDQQLALMSWAGTWDAMHNLINARLAALQEG